MATSRISIHDRMAHDFHSHGLAGIGLNRADELRLAAQRRNQLAALTGGPARRSLRFALGARLIAAGRVLAGTTRAPNQPAPADPALEGST